MYTLAITIVPSLIILLYFFISDKFKEPKSTIAIVFALGILICLPAGILNNFMSDNFGNPKNPNDLTYSFLGPAWTEEILKFLILYTIVLKRSEFNEPMDGIVYGVTVSLGFATLENIYYVYLLADYFETTSMAMAIGRSFSAVPAHAVFGVFMGYFFMKYSFIKKKDNLLFAFVVPFVLHGCYNLFVIS